jgi:hypothetical protein
MFGFNYILTPVNLEKGVVNLRPTIGTYAKCFAPTVVVLVGLWGFGTYIEWQEKQDAKKKSHLTPVD